MQELNPLSFYSIYYKTEIVIYNNVWYTSNMQVLIFEKFLDGFQIFSIIYLWYDHF